MTNEKRFISSRCQHDPDQHDDGHHQLVVRGDQEQQRAVQEQVRAARVRQENRKRNGRSSHCRAHSSNLPGKLGKQLFKWQRLENAWVFLTNLILHYNKKKYYTHLVN
jgi:hypothetical protein